MLRRLGSIPGIRSRFIEAFVLSNLAFLLLDVFIAHSINAFRHWAEWIPIYSSAVGTGLLFMGAVRGRFDSSHRLTSRIGMVVGWLAIVVGLLGLILHLKSQFFEQMTIQSLVYTAPFAAPLSFVGVGFLLILNRRVPLESVEWGKWVVFFAWGGFVGNFILTLCDHAQNGFFDRREWIPVVSSAIAVGFLFSPVFFDVEGPFLKLCLIILGIQVVVGVVGFGFHFIANLKGPGDGYLENFLYGTPVFAPLLFVNLAILAAVGIWDLQVKSSLSSATRNGG